MSGVLLIGALPKEVAGVAKHLGLRTPHKGQVLRGPNDVSLLRSGVGAQGADVAVLAVRRERPHTVLQFGFAGGLRAGLAEGDVLLVTEVESSDGSLATECAHTDALRTRLALLPGRLAQGKILTVPHFVHLPEDKRALAERHGAAACEMEAAPVATVCAELGVAYCGVRAISDSADRRLLRGVHDAHGRSLRRFLQDLFSPASPYRAMVMLHGARRGQRALDAAIPAALEALPRG